MTRVAALFVALLVSLVRPTSAWAHDFEWGVLALTERDPGVFDVGFTEPVDALGIIDPIRVTWPDGCVNEARVLRCERGLSGALGFTGFGNSPTKIVVTVRRLDGSQVSRIASGASPTVDVGATPARTGNAHWLRLGLEHVLSGADHLAFVVGLFLLAFRPEDRRGSLRRIVFTVSAFTASHSITLALGATGAVRVPRVPVEATIAVSILLVATEILRERPTLTRRFPWLIAFVFGLVHGLGFAGALGDVGLPRDSMALPLVLFNVGVEIGQLAVVAGLLLLRLIRAGAWERRRVAAYALGIASAYWFFDRAWPLVTG